MANTSRTMASRKRPPPGSTNGTNGGQAHPPQQAAVTGGVDAVLAKYARHLQPGQSITLTLRKGPTTAGVDPIAARRAAAKAARRAAASGMASSGMSSGNDTDDGGQAAATTTGVVPLAFPRVAKFPETVTPPDFFQGSLREGRMYEEEVPKAKDESDEEESTAYRPANGEGGADPSVNPKKKKRRWRRNDPRPRRWVLQEKAEFFDRIRKRKQRSSMGGGDNDDDEGQTISHQYHGVAEANASKYVFLSVAPPAPNAAAASSSAAAEQISVRPVHGFHAFSQPQKVASLTMEEAENAIEQQRNVVTRYMMHGKLSAQGGSSDKAAIASGGRGRPLGPAPKAMSRARLLGKLAGGGGDDDDEDVMADVRYSSSSRGSSRARKELLSSLGDEGMTVDDDGVLGGANDSEFGGKRRFARVSTAKKDAEDDSAKKTGRSSGGGATSTGFEAAAMEEGFYQRDVAAEYEALDYDANEQFDDDDVNVGEDEVMDDGGGYGGDFHDSGDDDALDSDEEDEDGLGGMATASGLKAMLAKARGESPVNVSADNAALAGLGADKLETSSPEGGTDEDGGIDKMLNAAKKTAEEMQKKPPVAASEDTSAATAEKMKAAAAAGIEKDKDGKRLITMEAVRREIWLNGGSITSKRLMKKFEVGKKNPERQELFKTIVMELCNMKKDADGNKLVLKQHYSKM